MPARFSANCLGYASVTSLSDDLDNFEPFVNYLSQRLDHFELVFGEYIFFIRLGRL